MVSGDPNPEMEIDANPMSVKQIPSPEVGTSSFVDGGVPESIKIPRKNPRKRKKALHADIVKQMEFYFGDANLSKDRFLAPLVREYHYVDLDVFLGFHKISALTTEKSRLVKALENSTILKVSDDGMKVCRTTPILERTNSEECTVYVQKLPMNADHDWLSATFSQFGPVVYVSIPKYKNSHNIKGFAFVEFEIPEDAQKCIKAFKSKGYLLPSETTPDQVLSITTYEEKPEMKDSEESINPVENVEENIETPKVQEQTNKKKKKKNSMKNANFKESDNDQTEIKKKKRKAVPESDLKDSDNEQNEIKNMKQESLSDTEPKNSNGDEIEINKGRKKKQFVENNKDKESEVDDDEIAEENKRGTKRKKEVFIDESANTSHVIKHETDECSPSSKKQKKHQKKESEAETENLPNEHRNKQQDDNNDENREQEPSGKKKNKFRKRTNHSLRDPESCTDMGMEIMTKTNWRKLRNKYLNLQKENMIKLKEHLRRTQNHWANSDRYGDRKMEVHRTENNVEMKDEKTGIQSQLVPGLIVKIEMNAPCCDPKNFKAEMKGHTGVKYIDVKEGASTAYIRCDTTESATLLSQKSSDDRRMSVIKDEEERNYWEKIKRDREEKIGNKTRVKQRGRDKLLKRAEKELGKHIKFDEV